jgi:hypothetical protein
MVFEMLIAGISFCLVAQVYATGGERANQHHIVVTRLSLAVGVESIPSILFR